MRCESQASFLPAPLQALALVASLRLRLQHFITKITQVASIVNIIPIHTKKKLKMHQSLALCMVIKP